jgi:hypothetical protein
VYQAAEFLLNNERDCYKHSPRNRLRGGIQKLIFDYPSHTCFNFDPRDELRRTQPELPAGVQNHGHLTYEEIIDRVEHLQMEEFPGEDEHHQMTIFSNQEKVEAE